MLKLVWTKLKGMKMDTTILDIAQFICDEFRREKGENITELDLQKYLYFSLRERLAIDGVLMFNEPLEGWKYGPVSPLVRGYFDAGEIATETRDISDLDKRIIFNVLHSYQGNLVSLSHNDISWQNARKGLSPDERGNTPLNVSDIRKDSGKIVPYDYVWDKPVSFLREEELTYSPETIESLNDEELDNEVFYSVKDLMKDLSR